MDHWHKASVLGKVKIDALLRPGRLDKIIYIPPPDEKVITVHIYSV